MKSMEQKLSDAYQAFFDFMNQEHDLVLTREQMNEILFQTALLKLELDDARDDDVRSYFVGFKTEGGQGSMAIQVEGFPSQTGLQNAIKRDLDAERVAILYIQELSNEDYEAYSKQD